MLSYLHDDAAGFFVADLNVEENFGIRHLGEGATEEGACGEAPLHYAQLFKKRHFANAPLLRCFCGLKGGGRPIRHPSDGLWRFVFLCVIN